MRSFNYHKVIFLEEENLVKVIVDLHFGNGLKMKEYKSTNYNQLQRNCFKSFFQGHDVPVQIGIVSRGIGCSRYNRPGIYVRVKKYLKWIRTIAKGC